MKEQLLRLMESEKLSSAKFADEIGVQRSNISHILNDRNKPSYDFILRILNRFSSINPEWLLTGKGNMYKTHQENAPRSVNQGDLFATEKTNIYLKSPENKSIPEKRDNPEKPTIKSPIKPEQTNSKDEITNVNIVKKVILLYQNGTFEEYTPNQ